MCNPSQKWKNLLYLKRMYFKITALENLNIISKERETSFLKTGSLCVGVFVCVWVCVRLTLTIATDGKTDMD